MRLALALAAAAGLEACTICGTELRSMPTLAPEVPVVHECPKAPGLFSSPASGAKVCFSAFGVDAEVEAENRQPLSLAFGPLLPLFPTFPKNDRSAQPLELELAFKTHVGYAFDPWRVSVKTTRGEILLVSSVRINVRRADGVSTVPIDRRDGGAQALSAQSSRVFLTFDRPVAIEEPFFLTLHLLAPDGADVAIPITFREGKVSYLGTVP